MPVPVPENAKFVLLTDTCCDLPKSYLDEHGVGVLHFTYTESGQPNGGLHGVDDFFETRSAHEFYDAIRNGAQPMTSQPSPAEFEEVFRAGLATGLPVVYLAFTSALSGCYTGALAVEARLREELGDQIPLHIVDTRTPSTPQGLYMVEAVRRREAGADVEEFLAWAQGAADNIHVLFLVDDLVALARGGRIPAGAAKVGSLLGVKPLLSIDLAGGLTMAGVARGRKKAIRKLADLFREEHDPALAGNVVAVGNADCPEDLPTLVAMLAEVDPASQVVETTIGPTIGCHVGPGMMSIAFWGASRRDGGANGPAE